MNDMKKIVIVSFFKSKNVGDILISRTVSRNFERQGYEVAKFDYLTARKVFEEQINSFNTDIGCEIATTLKPSTSLRSVAQAMLYAASRKKRIDLYEFSKDISRDTKVVFAGGNMIMDTTGSWPLILYDYVRCIEKRGGIYSFCAVGVGPIKFRLSRFIYGKILKGADFISTRGRFSNELAQSISGRLCQMTVDPVLINDFEFLHKRRENTDNFKDNGYVIGLGLIGESCFNNDHQYKKYCHDIEQLIKRTVSYSHIKKIILFSTEIADYISIEHIYNSLNGIAKLQIGRWITVNQLIDLYDNFSFIISSRMHSLIISQRMEIPYIGINWQRKLVEFSEVTNMADHIFSLKDISMIKTDIETVSQICSEKSVEKIRDNNNRISREYTKVMKA